MKRALIVIYFFILSYPLMACTAFCLKNDQQIFLAKNLDWEISDGIILINKKGVDKTAYGQQINLLSWVSKYGSVTFNQFGKEFPLGGMNEQGLVIEELNSWGETPSTDGKYELNEFQWTQFCLDNFANVEEVIKGIDRLVIVPLFINLHYLIADSDGNVAVIEFYNGSPYIYRGQDLPWPVLSNNHYENSLKYLHQFKGFGGHMEVKSDNSSNERFVKAATSLKEKKRTKLKKEMAFEMLEEVHQEDTQWRMVYDISNKSIHYKTLENKTIKTIEISHLDFSCETPISFLEIHNDEKRIQQRSFKKLEWDHQKELLMNVFNKYQSYNLGEISKAEFLHLAEYGYSIKCK